MRTMLGPGNYEARATPNMKRKHLDDFEAPPNKWQRGGVTSLTPLMRNAALRSPSPAMSPGQRSVVEVLRYPCGGAPVPAAPPARTRASGVWPSPAPPPGDRSAPSSHRLGGRCVTCARTTAQAVACGHCERATCASCVRHCEGCGGAFCGTCATTNYAARYERVFCLVCHEAAASPRDDDAMDVR